MTNILLNNRLTEPPRSSPQQDSGTLPRGNGPPVPPQTDGAHPVTFTDEFGSLAENSTTRELPTVSFYFAKIYHLKRKHNAFIFEDSWCRNRHRSLR